MKDKPFIDPHTHTTHSLLDGAIKIKDYINFAKDNNLEALFINDHGSIGGWIEFYNECKENNIKPILGFEAYISLKEKSKKYYHINLIAINEIGYKNIIKLVTYSNIDNFYYKPRITIEKLKEYSEGIICTTACVGSIWGKLLNKNHIKYAEYIIEIFLEIFKDNFYIEYGFHNFENEEKYIKLLYSISQKYNIKTIIGNDSHYLNKEDNLSHKIMMCKGENQTLINAQEKYNYEENYYKNKEEIKEIFNKFKYINIDECIENIYEIIEKCNISIEFGNYIYPEYKIENNKSQNKYLVELIKKNLKNRYNKLTKQIIDRINYELKIILDMNFAGYFLIVADYVNWAKNNNILVGCGRGSAAASIICYILGITDLCPLEYNLLFERFLNPDRVSFPDIDVDFDSKKRSLVFDYLKNKYGKYGFSNISTRGMLTAKASIKTVSSKLEYDFKKFNCLTSKIKNPAPKTIEEVLDIYPEIKKISESDEQVKNVFNIVKNIQGNIQSIGIHAGGVVISHENITDICPIIRTKDGYATAWTDKEIEKLGLIKFDILGLSNLSIIDNCLSIIDNNIDINNLNLQDETTFKLLKNGDTNGVFQFEEIFVKGLLKRISPEDINDLAIINACNRPGALDSGLTESYIKRRNKEEEIDYIVDDMKQYTKKTYGLPIFQEDILFLFRVMAGFSIAQADIARRAIGKKNPKELKKLRIEFISGSIKNGYSEKKAIEVFKIIDKFANYGFNIAHSVAYSKIGYQTAYLKANYRNEYMCSLLNNSIDNDNKKNIYIGECFENGIKILTPDINFSNIQFILNTDKDIVYPLTGIKDVGIKIVERIIKERNKNGHFSSFIDFCERCYPDKKTLTALLESNCFQKIEKHPKKWLNCIDSVCLAISKYKSNKQDENLYNIINNNIIKNIKIDNEYYKEINKKIQKNTILIKELNERKNILNKQIKENENKDVRKQIREEKKEIIEQIKKYGDIIIESKKNLENKDIFKLDIDKYFINNSKNFTKKEIKENELKYLAYNLTTNPMFIFQKYKEYFDFIEIEKISNEHINKKIDIIGEIKKVNIITTKKGDKMAFIIVSYNGFDISATIFPDLYRRIIINKDDFVRIQGTIENSRDTRNGDFIILVGQYNILNAISTQEEFIYDISNIKGNINKENIFKQLLTNNMIRCYNNNMDINKILVLKNKENKKIMPSKFWLNDEIKFLTEIKLYNL